MARYHARQPAGALNRRKGRIMPESVYKVVTYRAKVKVSFRYHPED